MGLGLGSGTGFGLRLGISFVTSVLSRVELVGDQVSIGN